MTTTRAFFGPWLTSLPLALALGTASFLGCSSDDPDHDGSSTSSSGAAGSTSSGGGGNTSSSGAAISSSSSGGPIVPGAKCTGAVKSTAADVADVPAVPTSLKVPAGFALEALGSVDGGRHIVALPNGDLLVGTNGTKVMLVPHADGAKAGTPTPFVTIDDAPVHGVAFDAASCTVYVGTQLGIYKMAYEDGQTTAVAGEPIAHVRPGGPLSHSTTSVAVVGDTLYAGVGSSCNACEETDPTRATVQRLNLDGSAMSTYAKRIRNPIALGLNPSTGTLWVGVAGQDDLPAGHPYEFFDALTSHPAGTDYGWPQCEENHVNYSGDDSVDCSGTVAPLVEMPAFSTLISATFYPEGQAGAHAFPAAYQGGAFLAAHGSWHKEDGTHFFSPPRVAFVKMNGAQPATPVDWNDPTTQWSEFLSGMQLDDQITRVARATGTAVGPDGSLFVTDDQAGLLFRIRPAP